jgi:enediyne biosynthesis protein E4
VSQIQRYKTGEFYTDAFRGDRSWNGREHKVLLRNEGIDAAGLPRFSDIGMAVGADDVKDGRGLAVADFDNDGALDLVINNNPGDNGCATVPPTLLRNNVGARRNWLAVELEGVRCNRDAVGAVVLAEISPTHCRAQPHLAQQLRHVTAGSGYASQHGARLYFGLGDVARVDRLTVRWPGGGEEVFTDVRAKQLVRVTEGKGVQYRGLPVKRAAVAKAGQ